MSKQPVEIAPWLLDMLQSAYESDLLPAEVLAALDRSNDRHPDITLAECARRSGYFFYRRKLYVPDSDNLKAEILRKAHKGPVTGHPGHSKTYELLLQAYYWPGMYQYVAR